MQRTTWDGAIDPTEASLRMNELLKDAFTATVGRDYEKAVSVIRAAVSSDETFGVEEMELMDHVYSCILNTSHYDESVIEVCWEWIDALERTPRANDPRVVASSQLSIYYAYHTISRVQERIPRRPTYVQMRQETWRRAKSSFEYLWAAAVQYWKPVELDRLDILGSWSYLAMQFADACDMETVQTIEAAKDHAQYVLSSTIVVEHSHQAGQRIGTIERNMADTRTAMEKQARRKSVPGDDISAISDDSMLPIKKIKTECV